MPSMTSSPMNLDFSRGRLTPFAHQREDTARLVNDPVVFLTSEMRTGKTKIVIDAAQFLFEFGEVDTVIIIAPAPVRDVWYDPDLGELAKHLWPDLPAHIFEFHSKFRSWKSGPREPVALRFIVTNYEYLRSKNRLKQLLPFARKGTLLVLDESMAVKNHLSQQTKACLQLRRQCGRVVLINGTPIYHSPLDLFSQSNILSPKILECPYITHFKARYALQEAVRGPGGKPLQSKFGTVQRVAGWTNLEDLQRRLAPYTIRRLQKDCLDLPPKLDPVTLTATLSPETWAAYKEMRSDMVVWLKDETVSTSKTAAIKALRLAQITSGILAGVSRTTADPSYEEGDPEAPTFFEPLDPVIIGREKINTLLWLLERRFEQEEHPKIVAWCRFRLELQEVVKAVKEHFPQFVVGSIQGGQNPEDRKRSLALLKPETSPDVPIFVAGIEGTGSFGLDMTASHTCVFLSCGYSPGRAAQTRDRVYGPAQKHPIAYFNIHAVGPDGQPTIDHIIEKARVQGENLATWTAEHWINALSK